MAFFRLKHIRNKQGKTYPYLYLVENTWKKRRKSSRQKVKAYLGRVHEFPQVKNLSFTDFLHTDDILSVIQEKSYAAVILDLVRWEFARHDVPAALFAERKIQHNGKDVALHMHEGYLCTFTLHKLLSFRPSEKEPAGAAFARAFVDSGIAVPKDVFVALYEKVTG